MQMHFLLSLSECLSHTPIIYGVAKCCFSPTHVSGRKKKKKTREGGQPQGSIISNPTSKVHRSLPHCLSFSLFLSLTAPLPPFSETEVRCLLIHNLGDLIQCVIEKEVNLLRGIILALHQEGSKHTRLVQNMKTGAKDTVQNWSMVDLTHHLLSLWLIWRLACVRICDGTVCVCLCARKWLSSPAMHEQSSEKTWKMTGHIFLFLSGSIPCKYHVFVNTASFTLSTAWPQQHWKTVMYL